ncbi:MAG: TraR/DksA C4-type zinc finger protein [Halanaerobiales bacterium]|nr:TraR/DksA C4-type zinc finger protein [Halanaerobiales bacterium]
MQQRKLNFYRTRLLQEKSRLQKEIERLTDEERLSLKESAGEMSAYDNHPADNASNTLERELDLGIKNNTIALYTQVKNALAQIETGRYGFCQSCGKEIKDSRLEVVPYTSFCINCQEAQEERELVQERPVAEEVLYPPFGRGLKEEIAQIDYEGEDGWLDRR